MLNRDQYFIDSSSPKKLPLIRRQVELVFASILPPTPKLCDILFSSLPLPAVIQDGHLIEQGNLVDVFY